MTHSSIPFYFTMHITSCKIKLVNNARSLSQFTYFADCGFEVYKKFVTKVEETCVGPNSKAKDKKGILPWSKFLRDEPGIKKPSPIMAGK